MYGIFGLCRRCQHSVCDAHQEGPLPSEFIAFHRRSLGSIVGRVKVSHESLDEPARLNVTLAAPITNICGDCHAQAASVVFWVMPMFSRHLAAVFSSVPLGFALATPSAHRRIPSLLLP